MASLEDTIVYVSTFSAINNGCCNHSMLIYLSPSAVLQSTNVRCPVEHQLSNLVPYPNQNKYSHQHFSAVPNSHLILWKFSLHRTIIRQNDKESQWKYVLFWIFNLNNSVILNSVECHKINLTEYKYHLNIWHISNHIVVCVCACMLAWMCIQKACHCHAYFCYFT